MHTHLHPNEADNLRDPFTVARRGLFLLLILSVAPSVSGALPGETTRGESVGSPVTPYSVDVDLATLPGARPWAPGDPVREVPKRAFPTGPATAGPLPGITAADPLPALQAEFEAGRNAANNPDAVSTLGPPLANIAGIPYNGINPPDVTMDAGPNHVIISTNGPQSSHFRVFNKSGAPLTGVLEMDTLAGGDADCTTGWGDPIVLYDRLADRWFMLEFLQTANYLCIYLSKTPDPVAGGWWVYKFLASGFPDYPHCGVWPDAYYCTDNEGNGSRPIYAYDRARMLLGQPARAQQRFTRPTLSGYSFQALTAIQFTGANAPPAGAPMLIMRHHDDEAHSATPDGARDFLDLFSLAINWTTPASSALTTLPQVPVAEYNSCFENYTTFDTIPQPGTARKLDPIREIVINAPVYRNFGAFETVSGAFSINQDPQCGNNKPVDGALRWFQLRKGCGGGWQLAGEGTYSPGDNVTHHFLGSLSIDRGGNLALGFNRTKTSAPTEFASMRYTGRLAADPPGVMSQGEQIVQSGGGVNSSQRWGDYAQMGTDPADDCTFWYAGIYQPSAQWATRIASFGFSECAAACAAPPMTTLTLAKSGTNLLHGWPAAAGAALYNIYGNPTPVNPAAWTTLDAGCLAAPGWTHVGQLTSPASRFYTVTAAAFCGAESPK